MQLVSKITLATFDFKKHLTISSTKWTILGGIFVGLIEKTKNHFYNTPFLNNFCMFFCF